MTNKEAISRIKEHMQIHFAAEYPHAVYITEALNMAIEALNEKEPVTPIIKQEMDNVTSDIDDVAFCGKCGEPIGRMKKNYCSNCGRMVKWE